MSKMVGVCVEVPDVANKGAVSGVDLLVQEGSMIYHGDNLDVMRGMECESVDLVYLDPPFNTGRDWGEFDDRWKLSSEDDAWFWGLQRDRKGLYYALHTAELTAGEGMKSYLVMLGIRLMEMRRLLKPTGSIYVHVDSRVSGYLRVVLDAIFGVKNFRNEIIWFYPDSPGRPRSDFPRKHDVIFRYSKSSEWIFNGDAVRVPILEASKKRYESTRVLGGKSYLGGESAEKGKIPETVWRIPVVKRNASQSTGYPTQKPVALLERIIKASSNEGDMVLDPFCGSGTTLVAAKRLGRRWIGIDMNARAVELSRGRVDDIRG